MLSPGLAIHGGACRSPRRQAAGEYPEALLQLAPCVGDGVGQVDAGAQPIAPKKELFAGRPFSTLSLTLKTLRCHQLPERGPPFGVIIRTAFSLLRKSLAMCGGPNPDEF